MCLHPLDVRAPPALSGHLTYYYWKPAHIDDQTVIAVGVPQRLLARLFANVRPEAVIGNRYGVRNEEVDRVIAVCRQPVMSLDRAWSSLEFYD